MNLPVLVGRGEPCVLRRDSGELVPLTDCTVGDLAGARDDIRDLESRLREVKALLDREVLARMDHEARWTLHADGFTLTAPAQDTQEEYDGVSLHAALDRLVTDGVIAQAAADAAVRIEYTCKPRVAGIRALLKRGGTVADVVSAHTTVVPRDRRVSVKRRVDA